MASRHVVLQQNRVEGGAVKPKNLGGGEIRNLRALGDIRNLVTVRGIDGKKLQVPQASRPVTRSICAQLLANAQGVAVEKNKKQRSIIGDGALEVKPVAKAAAAPKAVIHQKSGNSKLARLKKDKS